MEEKSVELRKKIAAILLLGSLIFLSAVHLSSRSEVSPLRINLEYRSLQPGEVLKLTLTHDRPIRKAQLRFLGERYVLGKGKDEGTSVAFLGLDLNLDPGTYPISASVVYEDGEQQNVKKEILVRDKEFPLKKLWVKEKYVTPPKEVMERIQRESQLLRAVYDIYTPRWWGEGSFIVPVKGKTHHNFGERRVFNNEPRSSHSGEDISSPSGTPVKASNSGKVVLADDLYFAGKTVIIDHGLGVFTLYCHFSRIRVQRGEAVQKGRVIGEIGATGRVTGPHLHWGVKVRGKRVDPFSLLSLELERRKGS